MVFPHWPRPRPITDSHLCALTGRTRLPMASGHRCRGGQWERIWEEGVGRAYKSGGRPVLSAQWISVAAVHRCLQGALLQSWPASLSSSYRCWRLCASLNPPSTSKRNSGMEVCEGVVRPTMGGRGVTGDRLDDYIPDRGNLLLWPYYRTPCLLMG